MISEGDKVIFEGQQAQEKLDIQTVRFHRFFFQTHRNLKR